jgi:spore germination protein KB
MSKVQISRYQIILALVWSVLGSGIVTVPFIITQFVIRDAWITLILFTVGGLVSTSVAALFVRVLPNRSLICGLIDALGPWLGRVFGLWILVWMYLVSCKTLREGTSFVGITILPQTPLYIIAFAGAIACSYAVYMGAEVVMRNGEFISPLALIVFPTLFALSMQHLDVHNLMPVLADGWHPVLRAAVTPDVTYALELLIGLQFAHMLRNNRTLPKDMIIVTGIITVVGILLAVVTVGVVGQSAGYLQFPILEAVRSIRIGRNLERLDTLYILGVMSTVLTKLAVFHYAWCEGMKDVFKLSSHRIVALSGGLLVWAGSIACFRSQLEVTNFMISVAPAYFVVTLVGIPILAVLVMAFRKRAKRRVC